jgi:hypothetical protein
LLRPLFRFVFPKERADLHVVLLQFRCPTAFEPGIMNRVIRVTDMEPYPEPIEAPVA